MARILKYVPCIFDKNFYLCASKCKTFIMLDYEKNCNNPPDEHDDRFLFGTKCP